jgi:hypothetical protein
MVVFIKQLYNNSPIQKTTLIIKASSPDPILPRQSKVSEEVAPVLEEKPEKVSTPVQPGRIKVYQQENCVYEFKIESSLFNLQKSVK